MLSPENIRDFFEKRNIKVGEVIKTDFVVTTSQPSEMHKVWLELPEPTQLYIIEEVQPKTLLQRLIPWRK